MVNWITVATFTYPTELSLVRSYLEAEEIEFNVKDELAVQADNFLSNAIGGVKLQVQEKDLERVKEIVVEFGYTPEQDFVASPFWTKFDEITSKIPFMRMLKVEVRFTVLAAVLLLFIVTFIYFGN